MTNWFGLQMLECYTVLLQKDMVEVATAWDVWILSLRLCKQTRIVRDAVVHPEKCSI